MDIASITNRIRAAFRPMGRQAAQDHQNHTHLSRELNGIAAVSLTDLNGIITEVNDTFCQLSRYSRQELLGNTHALLQSGKHSREFYEAMWKTLVDGKVWRGELCDQTKDGTCYWIDATIWPVRDVQGRPTGYLTLRHDITARKNAEAVDIAERRLFDSHIAASKQRLEIAISAVGFGVWEWDLVTGNVTWDDSMYELFGLNREECPEPYLAAQTCMSAADVNRIENEQEAALRLRRDWSSEFIITRPDGQVRTIRTQSKGVYDANGRPLRHTGVNWDVTEERKQEARLIQSSRMSSLGEMSANMAHEINNPLAIIIGKTQQLQNMLKRNDLNPERLREHLQAVQATTERIATIVRGLRTFARNGQHDPFESVSVDQLIGDTLTLCQERFAHSNIHLTYEASAQQLPALLDCRPSQIAQILLNLLNNAFDAVAPLSEKWVRLDLDVTEATVELSVTDSGAGIPLELQAKIMEPFFTTKAAGHGTGLGLGMVNCLVAAHGGKLTTDALCANTRFKIVLPKNQPPHLFRENIS